MSHIKEENLREVEVSEIVRMNAFEMRDFVESASSESSGIV
jgi:hypothetical protein